MTVGVATAVAEMAVEATAAARPAAVATAEAVTAGKTCVARSRRSRFRIHNGLRWMRSKLSIISLPVVVNFCSLLLLLSVDVVFFLCMCLSGWYS